MRTTENSIARAGSSPLTRGKRRKALGLTRAERLIPAHAGKTGLTALTGSSRAGSSPLTRGKLAVCRGQSVEGGLIPAHAGKTASIMARRASAAAHPRSRGENTPSSATAFSRAGSSPLTRGKPVNEETRSFTARLIPAHAGKTSRSPSRQPPVEAHPRSRGENISETDAILAPLGSSPLTRGKPRPQGRQARRQGLIPAHAGKTRGTTVSDRIGSAHPRSRGENPSILGPNVASSGSSPLTRGKPRDMAALVVAGGLIPAHAGKTTRWRECLTGCRAHPRSRGENVPSMHCRHRAGGSSPLTRGKPSCVFGCGRPTRLIPAHAGKTRRFLSRLATLPAHPRSRGENKMQARDLPLEAGSSPLTRGKRFLDAERSRDARLIPAHAGKT